MEKAWCASQRPLPVGHVLHAPHCPRQHPLVPQVPASASPEPQPQVHSGQGPLTGVVDTEVSCAYIWGLGWQMSQVLNSEGLVRKEIC